MDFEVILLIEEESQKIVGLNPVGTVGKKAQPPAYPIDMCVHWKGRNTAREKEHTSRGLGSHTIEREEAVKQFLARKTAEIIKHDLLCDQRGLEDRPDPSALRVSRSSRSDGSLQFLGRGFQNILPLREPGSKGGKCPVAIRVVSVL